MTSRYSAGIATALPDCNGVAGRESREIGGECRLTVPVERHRRIDLHEVPPGRTVLQFRFRDVVGSGRDWWLVIKPDGVDLCDFDPGGAAIATVETDLRTLTEVWRGDDRWPKAVQTGRLRLEAPVPVRRAIPRWLKLSAFAPIARPT